jgi:hypothetical protein
VSPGATPHSAAVARRRPVKLLTEAWRRFEAKVDPTEELSPAERARRAKLAYRALLRGAARKAAKTRQATARRRQAALQRRLARPTSAAELAEFERERAETIRSQIIWAASQRGARGIAGLRRRQLERADACALCERPFTEEDRASARRFGRGCGSIVTRTPGADPRHATSR